METSSLEAFKNNKIRPTTAGLADSKYTSKDCTVMLGITNPFVHELPEYYSYDITQFKGNIRFLEVVVNREGESNNIVALYFDGAVNYFRELPPPNQKTEVQKVINYINDTIRRRAAPVFLLMTNKLKNSFINSTGINSLSNRTSNSKEKKKLMITTATLLLIAILICFMSTSYSIALATVLEPMGYLDLILIVAILFSCILSFMTSIYKAQGTLFSSKDYDLLMALPIKNGTILTSKILSLMSISYIETALIIVPASIVYFIGFIFFLSESISPFANLLYVFSYLINDVISDFPFKSPVKPSFKTTTAGI